MPLSLFKTYVRYAPFSLSVILGGFIYWLVREHGYDDPYITYRYAENLYAGGGFVYNPGARVLSTTTPLFALLLAGIRFLTPALPQAANLIGAASLVIGGLCLREIAHRQGHPFAGWVALLLYPLSPLLITSLGSETPLCLALCLGTITLYLRQRTTLAAGVLALAVLARADAILLAGILALDWLIRAFWQPGKAASNERLSIPWRAILLGSGILLAWALWATAYFGSPLPVTLQVKRAQGLMGISELFAPSFLSTMRQYAAAWGVQGALFFAGVMRGWRKRAWLILLGWAGLYFLAYTWLGVTRYFWYYAPLLPGMVGMIGLGLDAVKRITLPVRAGHHSLAWLACLVLAGLGAAQIIYLTGPRFQPDPRLKAYRLAGEWLATHSPPDASVAALEVGIIGYYAHRPMVDFAGLIQPEVALLFTPANTYQDSATWAFHQYQPDYVVLQVNLLPVFEQDEVLRFCTNLHTFPTTQTGYAFDLTIYHCQYP